MTMVLELRQYFDEDEPFALFIYKTGALEIAQCLCSQTRTLERDESVGRRMIYRGLDCFYFLKP